EAAATQGRPLCWPSQPGAGRAVLDRAETLRRRARAEGLTEVALLGGGAAARAAELIAEAGPAAVSDADAASAHQSGQDPWDAGVPSPARPITVLDGPEPGPLLRIRDDRERLDRTVIVVTGDDPGTAALRRVLTGTLR